MKRKSNSLSSKERISKRKIEIEKNSLNITKSIMDKYEVQPQLETRNKLSSPVKDSDFSDTIPKSNWEHKGSVLIKSFKEFKGSTLILSFDLDDTLITPTDGKKFSNSENDWQFLYDLALIKKKIKEYIDKGYSICIFSNQNGMTTGQIKESVWKKKLEKVMAQLSIPIMLFAALEKDYYRKPAIGMLELFESQFNSNLVINRKESIFIGDAAGRLENPQKKGKSTKDFSCSDYKFALNAGLQFKTPEELFLDDKSQIIPSVESNLHQFDNMNNDHIKYDNTKVEMIILIGAPGSGKSTFTETHLVPQGYTRVNQDTLQTEKKCLQVAEDALSNKQSCVIDSTNPKKEKRSKFIELAKKYKAQVRCFIMDLPKEIVFHLNNLRNINKERKHYSSAVNNIPIHTFFKYYEEPKTSEGIDEIVKVNFVPGPFGSDKDKEIFYMYS